MGVLIFMLRGSFFLPRVMWAKSWGAFRSSLLFVIGKPIQLPLPFVPPFKLCGYLGLDPTLNPKLCQPVFCEGTRPVADLLGTSLIFALFRGMIADCADSPELG